ncbi:MAG: galactose-1-phosphate uridylyltransferase [Polyangia bacterium]|jgi:UDPglucose--hexose-1-phosphate uridylyltransferase
MPELRKDPIVGRWVIIATERGRRPVEALPPEPPRAGICPFCPGQEDKTPPEVLAYRPPDGPAARRDAPGWSLRVFPNKFPALMIEGDLDRSGEGVYDRMNGIGAHEVLVESPDHTRAFAQLEPGEIENVLSAFRDRIDDLKRDRRFKYVMIFKNQGTQAGASLEHGHTQLIALPVVPKNVAEEMEGADEYHRFKERCVFCDIVRQELSERSRLVFQNDGYVVIEPYAPKFPFETWVLPRRHRAAFETVPREEYRGLAEALKVGLGKLGAALDDPPYNFILHSAPFDHQDSPSYHWHFEIMPTLSRVAGFEWGSGFYINPTPPEEAARFLRELEI